MRFATVIFAAASIAAVADDTGVPTASNRFKWPWTQRQNEEILVAEDSADGIMPLAELSLPADRSQRRLVVAIDGTWQTPGSVSDVESLGGIKSSVAMVPSNIAKLAFLAANGTNQHDSQDPLDQLVYYHPGVGSEVNDKKNADLEGNFGNIHNHLLDAYSWLAREYRDGDEIYAFGFSRGSTIVRSLFSFIRFAGLTEADRFHSHESLMLRVNEAFEFYKSRDSDATQHSKRMQHFKEKHCHQHVNLKFLGVFDTVAALNVPDGYSRVVDSKSLTELEEKLGAIEPNEYHDLNVGSEVKFAYHALSLDEKRSYFPPTMFEKLTLLPEGHVREQKWFRGSHADVGGGFWERGLSDISLAWMAEKATAAGLKLASITDFEVALAPFLMGISKKDYESRNSRVIHDYFSNHPVQNSPNGDRVVRNLTKLMDPDLFYSSTFHSSVDELKDELPLLATK